VKREVGDAFGVFVICRRKTKREKRRRATRRRRSPRRRTRRIRRRRKRTAIAMRNNSCWVWEQKGGGSRG
jgi:hypothetical protein